MMSNIVDVEYGGGCGEKFAHIVVAVCLGGMVVMCGAAWISPQ